MASWVINWVSGSRSQIKCRIRICYTELASIFPARQCLSTWSPSPFSFIFTFVSSPLLNFSVRWDATSECFFINLDIFFKSYQASPPAPSALVIAISLLLCRSALWSVMSAHLGGSGGRPKAGRHRAGYSPGCRQSESGIGRISCCI